MKYSFKPLIHSNAKILILGSLPGIKSLQLNEYYGHRQNQFWKIMFAIFNTSSSNDYSVKCSLLQDNLIALWDVIKCADRTGSSDSNIKNHTPNDIPEFLGSHSNIRLVIFNGSYAFSNYKSNFGIPTFDFELLLSTSPACAGRDKEKFEMWERAVHRGLMAD